MVQAKSNTEKVKSALEAIRPHLLADGGDVELIDVSDDGVVKVKWLGNCMNCSMSHLTLAAGIEGTVKMYFPEVKEIIVVEDSEVIE